MTTQEVIKACINKELEPYGVTYDDVIIGGNNEVCYYYTRELKTYLFGLIKIPFLKEQSKPWYQFYTFESEQEFNAWKEFCINLFRKELKMSKAKAEREFGWFNLSYGLKQNYELDK